MNPEVITLWIAASALLLYVLCRSWMAGRYPAFTLLLIAGLMKYCFFNPWIAATYVVLETPVMMLKAAACMEAVMRRMEWAEGEFRKALAMMAITGGMLGAGLALGVRIRPTDLAEYNYIRVLIHWWLAMSMIVFLMCDWMWVDRADNAMPDKTHAWLLMLLCLSHAVAASLPVMGEELDAWLGIRSWFASARLAIYCAWLGIFIPWGLRRAVRLTQ